jgi:hypothetical protein
MRRREFIAEFGGAMAWPMIGRARTLEYRLNLICSF